MSQKQVTEDKAPQNGLLVDAISYMMPGAVPSAAIKTADKVVTALFDNGSKPADLKPLLDQLEAHDQHMVAQMKADNLAMRDEFQKAMAIVLEQHRKELEAERQKQTPCQGTCVIL